MVITLLGVIAILLLMIVLAKRDGNPEAVLRVLKQKQHKKAAGQIHVTRIEAVDSNIAFSSLGLIRTTKAAAVLEIPAHPPECGIRTFRGMLEFRFIENFDDAAFANAEDIGMLVINDETFSGSILCSEGFHTHLIALKNSNSGFSMDFSALFHSVFLFNHLNRGKRPFELRITEIDAIRAMNQAQLNQVTRAIDGQDSMESELPTCSKPAVSKPS